MSFGVSGSVRGEPFDYTAVFSAADDALYEAKQAGRDRVCVAGSAVDEGPQLMATVLAHNTAVVGPPGTVAGLGGEG
jgi:hypothetical protein